MLSVLLPFESSNGWIATFIALLYKLFHFFFQTGFFSFGLVSLRLSVAFAKYKNFKPKIFLRQELKRGCPSRHTA